MIGPRVQLGIELNLLHPLASLLSPAGKGARLSILIYHRVLDCPDPLCPEEIDASTFRWQMDLLARHFNVLPLTEAVRRLREGNLPARAACVTFDDGYADNAQVALPILQERGIPATFFIATGYLEGGRMWNDTVIEAMRRIPAGQLNLSRYGLGVYALESLEDRAAAAGQLLTLLKYLPPVEREEHTGLLASLADSPCPDNLMMNSQQVRKLHGAGMEIGAHTTSHPILARLDQAAVQREIAESRECLEGLIGERVGLFAYPNGKPGQDYLPEHVKMVRKLGFEAAVSTMWGISTMQTDCWQLPRFTPWDSTPVRFMVRLLWNCQRTSP